LKRVILDTNVIIAALFWQGPPRIVYDLVRKGQLVMLISEKMEKEFIRVLGYTKFGLTSAEILPFVRELRLRTVRIESHTILTEITADPTDNIFLECAVDGPADYIISGDKHLLALSSFQGIQVVRPKEFLLKEGYQQEE
jgi:putative PIN family toxin of toxin-antitoxin system